MRPFSEADFPLTAVGNRVYRKMEGSPICTASSDAMAQEIAKRMNRDANPAILSHLGPHHFAVDRRGWL